MGALLTALALAAAGVSGVPADGGVGHNVKSRDQAARAVRRLARAIRSGRVRRSVAERSVARVLEVRHDLP